MSQGGLAFRFLVAGRGLSGREIFCRLDYQPLALLVCRGNAAFVAIGILGIAKLLRLSRI